jgi:aldehyde:ferredoxin oxidoreductase
VGCHRKITITEPEEYKYNGIGPEYETLGLMGTNLLIDDPKVVSIANDMANRYGLDTISTGAMVGFAIECFEKGYISTEETDGMEYKWGDAKTLFALTEQIGLRKGFGAIFADGTVPAAEKIHPDMVDEVVHCKGLDFPSHDARSCISLAPGYATGTRGACHFRGPSEDVEMGGFFVPEVGIKEGSVKFFERENQSYVASKCQDLGVLTNSLVVCLFMINGGDWSLSGHAELFNAITGWNYSAQDLITAGERGFNVQRLNNLRDGYNSKTDVLPKRMFKPAKEGFRAGKTIPFRDLMDAYYEVRGWDDNGSPTEDTMKRLDL